MELFVPSNTGTSFYRTAPLYRQLSSPRLSLYRSNCMKCPRITRSELRASVGVTDRAGTQPASISTHKVTVHHRQRAVVHEFLVPEDQYILHNAESQNIALPFACRNVVESDCVNHGSFILLLSQHNGIGCCTSCAVPVKSGEIRQPEALGISAELKSKGYALLCVGFPSSDVEVETQDEDEVYWLQFARYFAQGPVERDDYAFELAMGDE